MTVTVNPAVSGSPAPDLSLRPGEDSTQGVRKVQQEFNPTVVDLSTDRTIKTGFGFCHQITVANGTASAVTFQAYDNTAASGTLYTTFVIPANSTYTGAINGLFSTGLTLKSLASASVVATVSFR